MRRFGEFINECIDRFKANLKFFALFGIIPAVITFVFLAVIFGLVVLSGLAASVADPDVAGAPSLIVLLIAVFAIFVMVVLLFIAATYLQIASFEIAKKKLKNYTFQSLMQDTKGRVLSFMWVQGLAGLIITLGLLLFIVPGIIFALWYMLAPYANLDEGLKGMDALRRSKELTQGLRGKIFLYIFGFSLLVSIAIGILSTVLELIPILGMLGSIYVQAFATPLTVIFAALVFFDVKKLKSKSR